MDTNHISRKGAQFKEYIIARLNYPFHSILISKGGPHSFIDEQINIQTM